MSATETIEETLTETLKDFVEQYAIKHNEDSAAVLSFMVKSSISLEAMLDELRTGNINPEQGRAVLEIASTMASAATSTIATLRGVPPEKSEEISQAAQHILAQLHKISDNA